MNRYRYDITKNVEVLAETDHDALCAVVLEDFDNEITKEINFLYKESEEFFDDDKPNLVQGSTSPNACADNPNVETCEDCGEEFVAENFDEASYDQGFSDGYDMGEFDERARIHEAIVSPV